MSVRAYDLGSIAQFRQVFPGESCYLQLAVCIYASQSELRHLQCMVSVGVCVHTTVCVCEPHLLQKYGCIEFEDGSSTGSSPGAKFGENPKKKKAIAIYQK